MSTRCWIGQRRADGIHSFYCHCDGYPEYMGFALTHFYDSEKAASDLVDMCEPYGIFSLHHNLEETRKEVYHEHGLRTPVYATSKEYEQAADFDIEYIYLWSRGSWKIFKGGSFKDIKKYEPKASKNIYFKKVLAE